MRYLSGVLLYSITLKVWPFTDRLSYLPFLNCVSILVKFLKCLISLCYGANMVFFFFIVWCSMDVCLSGMFCSTTSVLNPWFELPLRLFWR